MGKSFFSKSGLSLERLQTFLEIATYSGISSAAPSDTNRQSQYSRQLKELEEFFGAELVHRNKGMFELTAFGRDLFQIVQSNFTAMEDFANRCAKENVNVTIGAGESILQSLILPYLGQFRAEKKGVTLVLQNLQTEEAIQKLIDGRIDLGLVPEDRVHLPIKSTTIGLIEYQLIVPTEAKFPIRIKHFWENLSKQPIALLSGSKVAKAFEIAAEENDVKLDVCFKASSYSQLLEAVAQIKCSALLPTYVSTANLDAVVEKVPIKSLHSFSRSLAIAWNPRFGVLRPAINSTVEFMVPFLQSQLNQA